MQNIGVGVAIAFALLLLITFPGDTVQLLENAGEVLGTIWDAIRDLIREFI